MDGTQVVVIGSGPAGLTAARYLEKSSVQYVLISRESAPGDTKVCGGFVPRPALEEFQLEGFLGSHEIHGARLRFPGLEPRDIWFDEPVGVNASRADLGMALLGKIPPSSGDMKMGATVTSVQCNKHGCLVEYLQNNTSKQIESDLVIDASGTRPISIKNNGVRQYLSPVEIGYALQYQVGYSREQPLFPMLNHFYFGSEFSPRGYAWIFPRAGEAAVGTGGLLHMVRERNTPFAEYLDGLLKKELSEEVYAEQVNVVKREGALIPLAGVVTPSYGRRVLLAGDAAGHCSPISGEGIHYAMIAGRIASDVARECLRNNDFSIERLRSYERRWQKAFGSNLKWGRRIQTRFMDSPTGGSSSGFLESDTAMRAVAEMLLGLKSVRSAIIGCLPAYIKSRLAFWR